MTYKNQKVNLENRSGFESVRALQKTAWGKTEMPSKKFDNLTESEKNIKSSTVLFSSDSDENSTLSKIML